MTAPYKIGSLSYTYSMVEEFEVGDLIILKTEANIENIFIELENVVGVIFDGPKIIMASGNKIWYAYFDQEYERFPVGPHYFKKLSWASSK